METVVHEFLRAILAAREEIVAEFERKTRFVSADGDALPALQCTDAYELLGLHITLNALHTFFIDLKIFALDEHGDKTVTEFGSFPDEEEEWAWRSAREKIEAYIMKTKEKFHSEIRPAVLHGKDYSPVTEIRVRSSSSADSAPKVYVSEIGRPPPAGNLAARFAILDLEEKIRSGDVRTVEAAEAAMAAFTSRAKYSIAGPLGLAFTETMSAMSVPVAIFVRVALARALSGEDVGEVVDAWKGMERAVASTASTVTNGEAAHRRLEYAYIWSVAQ